ncbi:MAG: MarR family transcriptional regulator [Salinicola sp.]|uniref:MarR family winged helix-turn-helix transcriptional regulator n=1 Tax=Salinicola sp. TaxID=1978524 RepID=UPI001D6EC60D|nr:MarR family transcriptional regulator [Salinicola sp.]NRB57586.1 MarR family transcriptional regulator [Salinicola sp.]
MTSPSVMWQSLKGVFESVEHQVAKSLQRQHGLGLTEYRALHLLAAEPDAELRMQELAKRLGLNQSSVTRLVERMERNGHTIRDVCPDDKRGVYTVITKRGRQIHAEASQDYDSFLEAALDEASQTKTSSEIVSCLRQILACHGSPEHATEREDVVGKP